jgi:hypothetical protein
MRIHLVLVSITLSWQYKISNDRYLACIGKVAMPSMPGFGGRKPVENVPKTAYTGYFHLQKKLSYSHDAS